MGTFDLSGGKIHHDQQEDIFYFRCPHCKELCQVPRNEIRCTIFRHAVFKDGMRFVPPHASQQECERWLKEGLVYGCAKPFKFTGDKVEVCGYV